MNCEEELKNAFIFAWLGDKNRVEQITKECNKILSSYKSLYKEISEIRANISYDFELPKKLREKKINSEDIIQLALYRLTKRLELTFDLKVQNYKQLKYSILEIGFKKIIRAYCEKCEGYSYQILRSGVGFFAQYNELIYAEVYQGDINSIIAEINDNIRVKK
ncbi:hypothetical protein DFR86_02695 [Acidianus sulfidivorans JP7]|uniref:Uncharacterized protein n=1 Tax=Acidianus sulfidivorans JP7 TaxID=619593 RepID=A0A2U9IKM0_9CREN|nr:hypothetical protein [Acidianus sulfidivorans]AWR96563.1 hypothetical protein DFR86_02695 [Acidianus sulfidivorans JP7]